MEMPGPPSAESGLLRHEAPCQLNRILNGPDFPIKLLLVDLPENFAHSRPRGQPEFEQMTSEKQRWRWLMLDAKRARAVEEPVHRRAVEIAGSAQTIGARQPCEQLEVHLLGKPPECAVADICRFVEHAGLEVIRNQADDLCP